MYGLTRCWLWLSPASATEGQRASAEITAIPLPALTPDSRLHFRKRKWSWESLSTSQLDQSYLCRSARITWLAIAFPSTLWCWKSLAPISLKRLSKASFHNLSLVTVKEWRSPGWGWCGMHPANTLVPALWSSWRVMTPRLSWFLLPALWGLFPFKNLLCKHKGMSTGGQHACRGSLQPTGHGR